jgi:hypothetical protein
VAVLAVAPWLQETTTSSVLRISAMGDSQELQSILDRIEAGEGINHQEAKFLAAAVKSKTVKIVIAERAVNIEGSADGAVIVTGDRNIILSADAAKVFLEVLQAQGLIPQPTQILKNSQRIGIEEFIGRKKELNELHQYFQESNPIVIIAGMAGVGKTELIWQYTSQYKQHYSKICWFNARNHDDIEAEMTSFYLGGPLRPLEEFNQLRVNDKLSRFWSSLPPGNVLAVFDNVTDYWTIEPFLPPK